MITPHTRASKDFVTAEPHHLRTLASVRINAGESVSPFDRQQRSERTGRFERAAETRVVTKTGTKSWIVHRSAVRETIEADGAERKRRRGPQHRAAIVPNQRRRISVQAIVERAERVTAEAVEIAPAHRRGFNSRRDARVHHLRAQNTRAEALEIRVSRAVCIGIRKSPPAPSNPARVTAPDRSLPARALRVESHTNCMR